MSAVNNINGKVGKLAHAIEKLAKLKPVNMTNDAMEDMQQRAESLQTEIVVNGFELLAGFLLDINRIANALEAPPDDIELFAVKDRQS